MDEKNSSKPILVKKPARRAKALRKLPGQPVGQTKQELEDELDATPWPKVLVIDEGCPEHVRIVIAKFDTQELFPGSNMLVAGANFTNEQLVRFTRSLMTIAHGRGLSCHL